MAFDIGSFVMGWGVGLISAPLARRLQPLVMELAAAAGAVTDRAAVGVAQGGETLQDLFSDARDAFQRRRAASPKRRPAGQAPSHRRSGTGPRARRVKSRRARAATPAPRPA
jgi:hypothetical protein